jgi:hypothetical protein
VVDHAPASALSIAFIDASSFTDNLVVLTVDVVSGGHAVALSSKQQLACNGVTFSQPSLGGGLIAKVDRQPAGGSYKRARSSAATVFSPSCKRQ